MDTSVPHRRPMRLLAGLTGPLSLVLAVGAAAFPTSPGGSVTGFRGVLSGVSARSPNDAWAVGDTSTSSGRTGPLVLHWDGARWARMASPAPHGARFAALLAVSAQSAHDAWAVGRYTTSAGAEKGLILHWDGASWAPVASPTPAGAIAPTLFGVSARSPNDAWAVGSFAAIGVPGRTWVLHWNGTAWARIASPSPAGVFTLCELRGVSAPSPNDAWAVGDCFKNPVRIQTLALHWNGTKWARVPSPNPTRGFDSLSGVSVSSPNDVWAVGETDSQKCCLRKTLVLHWNGAKWAVMASPNPPTLALIGVSAQSRNNAWAVGFYVGGVSPGGVTRGVTLVQHWNGTRWAKVPSPSPGRIHGCVLSGVSAHSPNDAWAVGRCEPATLILHWTGTRWTRS